MLTYTDLPRTKKAFIFELDDVLYPEKDYLLQVYYLFANFIEYTEGFPLATDLVDFFKSASQYHEHDELFDLAKEVYGIDEKYLDNFNRLHKSAQLPLKLLLYKKVLKLLQDIVVDRKEIFLVTKGEPEIQLNKMKYVDWNGLEEYLTVYFADEIKPKPDTGVLTYILEKHQLTRKDLVIFGSSNVDEEFAANCGVDYVHVDDLN